MYSKLFSSILSSSIWSEDSDTCKVWITLIAMQDREGYVFGSPAGIARIAALPVEKVEAALRKFLAPDEQSADLTRVPEQEGRRIEVVPGGWRLLNAEHYRELGNQDARREQNREAKRKQREKESDGQQESAEVSNGQQASSLVPKCHPSEADAEASSDADVTQGKEEHAPENLVRVWQENRGTRAGVRLLTQDRRRAARARLRECPDLERWAAAARRLVSGYAADKNWADFDFLIRPGNLTRIEEGKYDAPKGNGSGRPHVPGRYTEESMARMKAEAEAEQEAVAQ